MKPKFWGASATAALLVALSVTAPARAAVLFNNGTPSVVGNYCSSNAPSTCQDGSQDYGWTIYDDFELTAAATVTGVTYELYFSSINGSGAYVSTNLSIWSANPQSFSSGSTFFENATFYENVVGTNTAGSIATTTITGLDIALGAGTYWIGMQNNVNGGETAYVEVAGTNVDASASDNSGLFFRPSIIFSTAPLPDAAFTIEGSVTTTPLPSTWTMLIAGFAGLGFFAYRGTKKNAATLAA